MVLRQLSQLCVAVPGTGWLNERSAELCVCRRLQSRQRQRKLWKKGQMKNRVQCFRSKLFSISPKEVLLSFPNCKKMLLLNKPTMWKICIQIIKHHIILQDTDKTAQKTTTKLLHHLFCRVLSSIKANNCKAKWEHQTYNATGGSASCSWMVEIAS